MDVNSSEWNESRRNFRSIHGQHIQVSSISAKPVQEYGISSAKTRLTLSNSEAQAAATRRKPGAGGVKSIPACSSTHASNISRLSRNKSIGKTV